MTIPKFTILAHRGLFDHHPENSMGAVTAALDEGFGLEVDVRVTRDHIPVLIHDQDTQRLSGHKISVAESTFDEIKSLSLENTSETIAALADVLNLPAIGDTEVAIHLKEIQHPNVAEILIDAVPKSVLDNVFVFDIPIKLCLRLKELEPRLRVGVSVGDKKYHPYFYDLDELVDTPVDIVWADEYRSLYAEDFFEEIARIGTTAYVVSPDIAGIVGHPLAEAGYQDTWQKVYSWGAAGICTDRPMELNLMLEAQRQ